MIRAYGAFDLRTSGALPLLGSFCKKLGLLITFLRRVKAKPLFGGDGGIRRDSCRQTTFHEKSELHMAGNRNSQQIGMKIHACETILIYITIQKINAFIFIFVTLNNSKSHEILRSIHFS